MIKQATIDNNLSCFDHQSKGFFALQVAHLLCWSKTILIKPGFAKSQTIYSSCANKKMIWTQKLSNSKMATCGKQVYSFETTIPKIVLVLCIASCTILKVDSDIHAIFGKMSWALEEGIGYHILQQSQLLELGQHIHILGSSPWSGDPTSVQASMLALESLKESIKSRKGLKIITTCFRMLE